MTDPARAEDFRTLVDLILEPVRRYLARRADADTVDDVVSETLLVCWRRLDQVPRAADGTFTEEAVPWSLGVARNLLANARRGARRRARLVGKIIALDPPSPVVADPSPEVDARTDRMAAALARLRSADAELLRLWAWDGLESPQLAIVLGISANAAAIRLHRAKARLRAEILADEAPVKAAHPAGHVRTERGNDDARR